MQFGLSFSCLLTALLFALAQVEAAPVNRPRTVTLPLKRLPRDLDVHPSVVSPTLDFFLRRDHGVNLRLSPSFCNSILIAATAVMRA